MKKFDLHIHTVSTQSDAPFTFSMEKLKQYVVERQIDAIAITNHNIFDLAQYKAIVSELSNIVVFPGIEINIGHNAGHLIAIARPDDADDFTLFDMKGHMVNSDQPAKMDRQIFYIK